MFCFFWETLCVLLNETKRTDKLTNCFLRKTGFPKVRVRLPFELRAGPTGSGLAGRLARDGPAGLLSSLWRSNSSANDRLASALILLAMLIAILSTLVVIYQCGSMAGLSWGQSEAGLQLPVVYAPGQQQMQAPAPMGTKTMEQFFLNNTQLYPSPQPNLAHLAAGPKVGSELAQGGRFMNYDQLDLQQQANYSTSTTTAATNSVDSKEYETQMLKMALLFDDSQSFDGQNVNAKSIVNQNLIA